MRTHRLNDLLSVTIRYTYTRNGYFYYQRAVPDDLVDRYGKKTVKKALKTTSPETALRLVARINATLEAEWNGLRANPLSSPSSLTVHSKQLLSDWGLSPKGEGRNDPESLELFRDYLGEEAAARSGLDERPLDNLLPVERQAMELLFKGHQPTLEDALQFYFEWHSRGQDLRFQKLPKVSVQQFSAVVGDKSLLDISREDVRKWMFKAVENGQSKATIRRRLGSLAAIVSVLIKEKELDFPNRFQSHSIPAGAAQPVKRKAFSRQELETIQKACLQADDDMRYIVAMLSDSCSRLAEIVGLRLEDISLDSPIPFMRLVEHSARSLKTRASERSVPLVGLALWAAHRVKSKASKGQIYAFPRYIKGGRCQADSASASLNKWLRTIDVAGTSHAFRHAMHDRLRDVGCPEDVRQQIGGWSRSDMASQYGDGYSLERMREYLRKTVLPNNLLGATSA